MIFDPRYFFVVGPFMLLALAASFYVKSAFRQWSKYGIRRGMNGAQIAAEVIRAAGIQGVRIERASGFLSDHYDPRERVVRLSPQVHDSTSIAACAVAAHEVGHAIQHQHRYAPLALRNAAVPTASIGSSFGVGAMLLGLVFSAKPLIAIGIILFCAVVLFQLITLPVEFDASRRAKAILLDGGFVNEEEAVGVRRVLNAAALTYVAAALTSIATLVYYLGFLRSDD